MTDMLNYDVVFSARVQLLRNLNEIPFPARMSPAQRKNVIEKVRSAVLNEHGSLAGNFGYIDLEEIKPAEAVALVERGVSDADFIADRKGRGLFLSNDNALCIMINGEDHILIQSVTPGFDLQKAYDRADRIDTILEKSLCFAFDAKLGYLTGNPAEIGTAMKASFTLHLPALTETGALGRLSGNLLRLGMSLRAVENLTLKPQGAVYRLLNRMTLGISEHDALKNLNDIAMQVILQEREARKKLICEPRVRSSVETALNTLQTARTLSFNEFLGLISVVRFGASVGVVRAISLEDIDGLTARVRPARIALENGGDLSTARRRAIRAETVRQIFEEI